ncbi:MAG: hypothetical protein NTZ55_01105 [Candidatus Roizmanbacteria bacterium]|nr:hypothetical protein [Candidatus Roizmanbacteria bacterium]
MIKIIKKFPLYHFVQENAPFFLMLFCVLSICTILIGTTTIFSLIKKKETPLQLKVVKKSSVSIPTPTPTLIPRILQKASLQEIVTPSIVGSIKKINKDLNLVIDENRSGVTYFETGKYISGKYKGYTRIVSLQDGFMSGVINHLFITNDDKNYILLDNQKKAEAYPLSHYLNPLNGVNQSKIIKIEEVPSDLPDVIKLDDTFALFKKKILTEADKTVATSEALYAYKPQSNFSSYKNLSSQNSFLTFYAMPAYPIGGWTEQRYTEEDMAFQKNELKYTTGVIVQDDTGLSYEYTLSRLSNIKSNPKKSSDLYNVEVNFSSLYLSIKKEEIKTKNALYTLYDVAIPRNCASSPDTYVVSNINSDQLLSIGKTNDDIELYKLKGESQYSFLYNLQLDSKPGSEKIWNRASNELVNYPTLEDYVAKNPILFFKDPWGRWVALGEFDYVLPGGCGKPVIYLYPEKKEKVSLSFNQPIQFEVNIPTYHNGWIVDASPNGTLTDLQPQHTDCDLIDTNKTGSEYAKKSCIQNTYPYIYWSGNTVGEPYPTSISHGWYVSKEDLKMFMGKKLIEIGLNQKESNDMMEYWIPQMESKNAPYYKISFLMTRQMNDLIPMSIQPQPNSILRVFLDYLPLLKKPTDTISPQTITPFIRNGFTVVEWGGLKR